MSNADTPQFGNCQSIVVTTADGRIYDLGSPDSLLFGLRLKRYQMLRQQELKRSESQSQT